jgi:quercetin dioxygenase-like cupin family protein
MSCIGLVAQGWDVAALQKQLADHPELWDQHRHRTIGYGPHGGVSDIWVRYRDFAQFDGDPVAFHSGEHESVWYPCIAQIPAAWSLARKVRRLSGKQRLGGVLITRIPPGGEVKPHIDRGWHAESHEKYIVQVKGGDRQAFCFEGEELRANDGDVYWFRNDRSHWVTNESDRERISLIVCVRD